MPAVLSLTQSSATLNPCMMSATCNINAGTSSSSLAEGLGHPCDVSCSDVKVCSRACCKMAAVAHKQGMEMLT